MNTTLYLLSKKIHRILVLLMIVISSIMAVTGMFMKYEFIVKLFPFVDQVLMRYLHNQSSTIFSIVLACMIITGSIMYIFPLMRKSSPKPVVPPPLNPVSMP